MSFDAGFSQTGGLPSSVFTLTQPEVSDCTACFVVACKKFDPGKSPPAAAIIIEGIERIKLLNPFLGEMIGGIAMSHLRSSFSNQITADMDCAAVINLQDQQSHMPPEQASDQKRMYGALLRALIQGKGNQPPIKHGYAHPERFHPATKTMPARPTIPRSKWDKRLWLNHMTDRYASHNFTPEMIADNLRPRRVFRIRVEDLLSEVMSPDSLFWSSARIPSVNSICSMNSPGIESAGYLQQRNAQTANEDPHQIQYYPLGYWSNSAIGLIKPVLDKLAGKCFSDLRVAFLNLIWDYIPTGRRKGMFSKKCPDDCLLCGLPDSLDHIVLRCTSLNSTRQQIKRDVNLPFLRGKSSPSALPAGATPRIREYIRQYISRAFNDEHSGSSPDTHAVAIWMARPQIDTLRSLDRPFTSARLSVVEARYLQKVLVSVSSKLLAGASRM
jgi:hypothetical protein